MRTDVALLKEYLATLEMKVKSAEYKVKYHKTELKEYESELSFWEERLKETQKVITQKEDEERDERRKRNDPSPVVRENN